MEINRNEATRTITVWLTNADQQNEAIQNWLKSKYPVWKKQGYLTAVYLSGHEDLYENTLALLKYNRRLSAQKEVEAEKQARKQAEAERQAAVHPAAEMTAAAQPAAEMRAGTQAAAEHRTAKPSILKKLGKKPEAAQRPGVQSGTKQRARKRSETER